MHVTRSACKQSLLPPFFFFLFLFFLWRVFSPLFKIFRMFFLFCLLRSQRVIGGGTGSAGKRLLRPLFLFCFSVVLSLAGLPSQFKMISTYHFLFVFIRNGLLKEITGSASK